MLIMTNTYLKPMGDGIIFGNQGEPLIGKVINKIKIKSNITHKNVQVTWISYAGK